MTGNTENARPVGALEAVGALWQVAAKSGGSYAAGHVERASTPPDLDLPPAAKTLSQLEMWMVAYIPILVVIALAYFVFSGR
jgi:hypothetical protein